MITDFPAPWRIVEIPNGFAVDDATGQQLGVFYGRADPNTAGHTGFLTIEEARQNPAAAALKYVFEVEDPNAVIAKAGIAKRD